MPQDTAPAPDSADPDPKHAHRADPPPIDWIIFTACLLGCATVVAASLAAGEAGLAAHVGLYVSNAAHF